MTVQQKQKIVHTAHSLVGRTALAMYESTATADVKPPSFLAISQDERDRFEKMACAALAVALSEPVLS